MQSSTTAQQRAANRSHREVSYAPDVVKRAASQTQSNQADKPARSSDRISLRGRAGRTHISKLSPAVSPPNEAQMPCPVSVPSCLSPWPNGLGYDLGEAEIWIHRSCFRVFAHGKVLRVPYARTTDPLEAYSLCLDYGLDTAMLDELDPDEAHKLYMRGI